MAEQPSTALAREITALVTRRLADGEVDPLGAVAALLTALARLVASDARDERRAALLRLIRKGLPPLVTAEVLRNLQRDRDYLEAALALNPVTDRPRRH